MDKKIPQNPPAGIQPNAVESPEPVECSSPPCLLHELDPAFAGLSEPAAAPPPAPASKPK
ncbi:MAG TPA: hypothetical protein PLY97_07505 [Acidocella sp.]|nr:hypothetical protein [Acidocella sp.]